MDNETRNHPRVTGSAAVELSCAEGKQACRVFNLSLAGCYVETRGSMLNPQVDVLFRVPGGRAQITCPAEVVRKDWKSDGRIGLALRFLSADWVELLGLARIIAPQLG